MSIFCPNNTTVYLTTPYTGVATQALTIMNWALLGTPNPLAIRHMIYGQPNIGLRTPADGVTSNFVTNGTVYAGQVLTANVWYHLCETVLPSSTTARTVNGYVNGVPQFAPAADVTTFVAYTEFSISGPTANPPGHPLVGNVRDVRVWTRVLNQREIIDEMNSRYPVHLAGLLIWSPFDDDTYTDKSGNGHIWTMAAAGIVNQSGPLPPWTGRGYSIG